MLNFKKMFIVVISTLIAMSCSLSKRVEDKTQSRIIESRGIAEDFFRSSPDEFSSTNIESSYIWYNPVVEGPAYIEYVLEDSGYVFISLIDNDVLIGAYGTGESVYERIESELNEHDFTPYKMSHISYVAKIDDGRVLEYSIIDNSFNYSQEGRSTNSIFNSYVDRIKENNGVIGVRADFLDEKRNLSEDDYYKSRGIFSDKYKRATLPGYTTKLPSYEQFEYGSSWSGCVPTALAMATGYWYLKHGKTSLYGSKPDLRTVDNNIKKEILRIRKTVKTDSNGITTIPNSALFQNYLWSKGFANSVVQVLVATEWNHYDWTSIYNHTKAGKPVVLFYHKSNGRGHGAVVTSVKIKKAWTGWYKKIYMDLYSGANNGSSPETDYVTSGSNDLGGAVTFTVLY